MIRRLSWLVIWQQPLGRHIFLGCLFVPTASQARLPCGGPDQAVGLRVSWAWWHDGDMPSKGEFALTGCTHGGDGDHVEAELQLGSWICPCC